MISCTDLPSGGVLEQLNYDEPKLDSKVLRLMITADTPHREEGLHGSKFVECMDYSITSFQMDPRVKKANNQTTAPLSTMASSAASQAPAPRPISRGFGNFVRKLSLRAPPKRDPPASPPSGLIQFQPVHQNSSSAKLCRKKSEKGRRSISALVIEAGKNEPWCAGFGKKTFTPACPLDCTASPLCMLSSSTSGSSTHSRTLKTRQAKHDGSTEMEIMRQVDQRCSSTTHIHIPEPSSLRSMSTSSSHSPDTSFEVVSRSNFTRRKTSSSRHSESLSRSIVGNTTPT
ncbi:hypothetical protein PSTG_10553 [Puccinia striiformis f. sp. tritici PST-78]|uniref:Uncharacterized protein n=1 Tax=Puccinia striiformis f. sp. tritici PST-78 TaxID=1165861 RepID=A0A0L0VA19_9BASI|nr:hypothetical protein PSTG_10553 [Puccinia striiformis f. sp. tritici PST-78]